MLTWFFKLFEQAPRPSNYIVWMQTPGTNYVQYVAYSDGRVGHEFCENRCYAHHFTDLFEAEQVAAACRAGGDDAGLIRVPIR